MLRGFADVSIAFVELLEAQARQLGKGAVRTAASIGAIVIIALLAGGMLIGGTGLLAWSLYLALEDRLSPSLSAALTGLAVWLVIGVGAWIALNTFRKRG